MKPSSQDPEDTELATGFTVRDYKTARDAGATSRGRIADAIKLRFTERYITPARSTPTHGFTMMAIACLMVEALESFKRGWKRSTGRSQEIFCAFLDREEPFQDFRGAGGQLYKHVRCGILHQAESTGGWKIRRNGPLFHPDTHTINAAEFISRL